MHRPALRAAAFCLVVTFLSAGATAAAPDASLRAMLFPEVKIEALRARGPAVAAGLAALYPRASEQERSVIAWTFYQLGFKSAEAKRALMADIHTANSDLRLQVQWALGRVSNDRDVIDALLGNMQHDDNPLFRDKAACALAHDQIHLTEDQKAYMYERLIAALRDPKDQVRDIAIKVLEIQTGQTKGFAPQAPVDLREKSIRIWEQWLADYRANM
jgi:HEAT repeat protein